MRNLVLAAVAAAWLATTAGAALAQPDDHAAWAVDQGASHHWNSGERMGRTDWSSAQPIDYRQHNLRAPPSGYEWRESNGQYVLAAVATGLIASVILDGDR
jgi:Ni/Co efflux regulator RcnB